MCQIYDSAAKLPVLWDLAARSSNHCAMVNTCQARVSSSSSIMRERVVHCNSAVVRVILLYSDRAGCSTITLAGTCSEHAVTWSTRSICAVSVLACTLQDFADVSRLLDRHIEFRVLCMNVHTRVVSSIIEHRSVACATVYRFTSHVPLSDIRVPVRPVSIKCQGVSGPPMEFWFRGAARCY
jgi:hypothetical protein